MNEEGREGGGEGGREGREREKEEKEKERRSAYSKTRTPQLDVGKKKPDGNRGATKWRGGPAAVRRKSKVFRHG